MSTSTSTTSAPEFWLLKIPNFLHDQFEECKKANAAAAASNPSFSKQVQLGQPIAELWIEKKPKQIGTLTRKAQMKLVVRQRPTSTTPTSMSPATTVPPVELNVQTKPKSTMLVFGASVPPSSNQLAIAALKSATLGKPQPTPEAFKLEGDVALLADCTPRTNTQQYKVMLANRMAEAQAKVHTIKKLEDSRDTYVTPIGAGMIPIKRKHDRTARDEKPDKRVRMDEGPLERAILDLMSKPQYSFVTVTNVANILAQPTGAVSDMFKRLCIRQEEGLNKGLYTLKPEYKLAGDVVDPSAQPIPMDLTSNPFFPTIPPPSQFFNQLPYQVKPEPPVKPEY